MGDLNGNENIDLVDSIIALQIVAGIIPSQTVHTGADVNGDGKIGMAEVIYILQKVAGSNAYHPPV